MRTITTIKDIDSLMKGDQYVIQPVGYDLQKPEDLHTFTNQIDDIQKAIEDKFAPKDVVNEVITEIDKMTEVQLVTYWKTIGADVNIKYSKTKNILNIKSVL